MTTGAGFAHPDYLVDPEWLMNHLDDENLVVVDGDVEAGYLRGHIPGAVLVPDNYAKDPETGRVHILAPEKFAAFCQNLGIGDDTLVVTYDNNQSLYATRLWWALNYYGHTNVKVLDGGWRTWIYGGWPVDFDRASAKPGATFTPKIDESIMVRADELKDACSLEDAVIWDVRSDGEYTGANDRGNQRAGHIPGAVHLEWFNVMERDSHKFKPPAEIRQLLADKGITPDKAVFAY